MQGDAFLGDRRICLDDLLHARFDGCQLLGIEVRAPGDLAKVASKGDRMVDDDLRFRVQLVYGGKQQEGQRAPVHAAPVPLGQ